MLTNDRARFVCLSSSLQVANFYNTIKEKIIPSQMGMLLLEAQKFERAIREQKGTKWNNTEECERYMTKLMQITEELTTRNTKLKSLHLNLASNVEGLLHPPYDLVKNKDLFLDQVGKLKAVIDREAMRGSSTKEAMMLWRTHWNAQLYKVVNFQYQWLLETLNGDGSSGGTGAGATGNLSVQSSGSSSSSGGSPDKSISLPSFLDIPVELRFTHQKLGFKPPLEDLRTTYYRNLKKFLDLPKMFAGFTELPSGQSSGGNVAIQTGVFSQIPERNAEGLQNIYVQAETLFVQLKAVLQKYEPWMALGQWKHH
jgi:dynein heavy chain 2